MEAEAKAELNKKAHSAVILCLGNKVFKRGRTNVEESRQSRGKSRSKSQVEDSSAIFQSEDHLKRKQGSVQLGDNRECKIRGTLEKEGYTVKLQSGKVKVINGSRVILSGIRRDNCVYSLDGHALRDYRAAVAVWQIKVKTIVHSDFMVPSSVGNIGMSEVFLTNVDDYSRRGTWSSMKRCNMYKDTLKNSGAGADKSVKELQVEVELQRLNNHTPEEDQTDQEDGDDENAGDQATDQPPDLTDY
ncbi:hypothetical protein Tco_0560801 [Tanacetum coccineum]